MFDQIAPRYDLLNRLMSLGMDGAWRRHLLDAVGAPGALLDLATGTADVAIAAARRFPGAAVVGLDPSGQMLALGAVKIAARSLGSRICLLEGDAQELPFASGRFDAVTIAFGIRNVPDRPRALREMRRVLRSGGRLGILELGEPADGAFVGPSRFYIHSLVPALGKLLSSEEEYRYLSRSIAAFPPAVEFAKTVAEAGFGGVGVRRLMAGAVHVFSGVAP